MNKIYIAISVMLISCYQDKPFDDGLNHETKKVLDNDGERTVTNIEVNELSIKKCILENNATDIQGIIEILSKDMNVNDIRLSFTINNVILNEIPLLHFTVVYGSSAMLKQMLAFGLDVNKKDDNGQSPIFMAISISQIKSEMLVENGADLFIVDKLNRNMLHELSLQPYRNCSNEIISTMELMIQKGVNVNQKDIFGMTPLHYSAYLRNPKITTTLIKHNANKDIVNNYGQRPVDMVNYNGDFALDDMNKLFEENRSDAIDEVLKLLK